MTYGINFQPKELFSAGQRFGSDWVLTISDAIKNLKMDTGYSEFHSGGSKLVIVKDDVQHYFELVGTIIVNGNLVKPQDCIVSKSVIEYINKQNQNE